jgi:uncharacterized membrane-anchored protein YjiN (DUF445 family)
MKAAPPGWEPHKVTSRIDGWIVDPENEDRIPASVAEMIARAMPLLGGDNTVAAIKARMVARQRAHERGRKRQRIVNRMASLRHAK